MLRPSFDEYFLMIALDVAVRSDDPNIQHGAIIVNSVNQIIGCGYNGTIRGADTSKIPLNIRDKKRPYMIHAEENAILNCVGKPLVEHGCKIYVTGEPCVNCLQRIINFGVREIIHIDRKGSITENQESQEMRENILSMVDLEIRKYPVDNVWFRNNLIGI